MERNSQPGRMIPGAAHGLLQLRGSMHMHHQQNLHAPIHHYQQQQQLNQPHPQGAMAHPQMHDAFLPPLPPNSMQECGQKLPAIPAVGYNKGECGKMSTSNEDEWSFNTEDVTDECDDSGKGKKSFPWHRMKWTDGMVKLLITAVSYAGEDAPSDCLDRRMKSAITHRNGKWQSISKVMAERGCCVSPQQCEDKFNDLNKRYKRLNDILGRGTACMVVENPSLLDLMDHLTDKAKDNVRKILSSKQLFYEEMCSFHNNNRLHLPDDPALQKSLHSALRSGDDHEMMRTSPEDVNEDDQVVNTDGLEDDIKENGTLYRDIGSSSFPKRIKLGLDHDQMTLGKSSGSQDSIKRPHPQFVSMDMNQVFPEGSKSDYEKKQWVKSRSVQLEEQRLHIQAQMMELERQHFKWLQFINKKDRELDKTRMEIEMMKLENEKMRLELKRKELQINLN